MSSRLIVPLLAGLALTACDPAQEPAGNAAFPAENVATNMADGTNATQAVLAMNDRQRNVVFIRALMDAGIDCQSVDSSERLPDQDGKPLWRATCGGGAGAHMITISPDGTANIVSRSDR